MKFFDSSLVILSMSLRTKSSKSEGSSTSLVFSLRVTALIDVRDRADPPADPPLLVGVVVLVCDEPGVLGVVVPCLRFIKNVLRASCVLVCSRACSSEAGMMTGLGFHLSPYFGLLLLL